MRANGVENCSTSACDDSERGRETRGSGVLLYMCCVEAEKVSVMW